MNATDSVMQDKISCRHVISYGYSMKTMHAHDGYEIHFTRCSGLNFFIDDKIYPVKNNSLFVFTSTNLHKINVPDNVLYERYLIYFDPSLARAMSDADTDLLECFERRPDDISPRLSLSDSDALRFTALANELHDTFESNDPYGREIRLKLVLGEILLMINILFRRKYAIGNDNENESAFQHRIEIITQYINEHFSEEIRLSDMAAVCNLDKTYLCRLFKNSTGLCITDYINYRRLSYAALQLRSGKSVSESARACGFNSDAYFITTFKRILGCTPKQYAKANYIKD